MVLKQKFIVFTYKKKKTKKKNKIKNLAKSANLLNFIVLEAPQAMLQ